MPERHRRAWSSAQAGASALVAPAGVVAGSATGSVTLDIVDRVPGSAADMAVAPTVADHAGLIARRGTAGGTRARAEASSTQEGIHRETAPSHAGRQGRDDAPGRLGVAVVAFASAPEALALSQAIGAGHEAHRGQHTAGSDTTAAPTTLVTGAARHGHRLARGARIRDEADLLLAKSRNCQGQEHASQEQEGVSSDHRPHLSFVPFEVTGRALASPVNTGLRA